jgi:hypothetical protein
MKVKELSIDALNGVNYGYDKRPVELVYDTDAIIITSQTEKPLEAPEDWKSKDITTIFPLHNLVRIRYETIPQKKDK